MKYLLDFVIPQGPTGPPSQGLSAYGGKYNNTSQTINLSIGTPAQVNLANSMPSSNVTTTGNNTIVINQAGTYEINYYINLSVAIAAAVTMAVRVGGVNISSTVITRSLSVGTNSIYSGSTIVTLSSGAILDLVVTSGIAANLTLGSGVNASLSVKKLN